MNEFTTDFQRPRWVRDLIRFLHLKPQFVLSGNVRDYQVAEATPGQIIARPLVDVLAAELFADGYAAVVTYDVVNGFQALPHNGQDTSAAAAVLNSLGLVPGNNGKAPAGLELFAETLERLVTSRGEPVALVADFASRLLTRSDHPSPPEHAAFTRALVLSHQAAGNVAGQPQRRFWNTVIWVAEKEGDLPDWFLVGNPRIRHIPVAKPDSSTRRALAPSLLRALDGFRTAPEQATRAAFDAFVDQTEGLLLLDMMSIVQLGRSEGLPFSAIGDAVRRYKVGVTDDPWARIPLDKVKDGDAFIRFRVRGQDHAVTHVLDIVKRAVTGVGAPRRGNRPRGVAFLAGPTGVGKTELAKTLTKLLFGDEGAYIRFDMSEFSAEHSDQRLIGAPPGYIGYDTGGELTNAIREKPFSVVLFDEIEKAHPRILDKFLQILDDGVLTSGRGDRVYFSEAFIIFTSNLGIYRMEADGSRVPNVRPEDPFDEVQSRVRAEIERHFKLALNRPEILNRIGDNIVVFDFIRPEIANEIFDMLVDDVLREAVPSRDVTVSISPAARETLRALCLADLSNGGRGIRNKVETHLINPLARALFDSGFLSKGDLHVQSITARPGGVTALDLTAR
jgi:energy-coupling factor transporter ATP-binding protein EcfA2